MDGILDLCGVIGTPVSWKLLNAAGCNLLYFVQQEILCALN